MGLRAALRLDAALRAAPAVTGFPVGSGYGGSLLPASPWADTPLTQINLEDVFGWVDPDLIAASRSEAMSVPAVAAARHRVCGTLARLPMAAYRGHTDEVYLDEGQVPDLLERPDPAEPQFQTMIKTYDDVFFEGAAYWAVTATDHSGRPSAVTYVPYAQVNVDNDGLPTIETAFSDWLFRTQGGRTIIGNTGQTPRPWVLWFAGPHPGMLRYGARTIRSSIAMDRAAGRAADNPVPSIELHQTNDADMPDSEIRKLIANWMAARRGENGGVGYTSAGVEARALGQQPEQLLVEGRNQQAVEVARLAGIPAASIDASLPGTALTYANLLDRLRDLVDFGLQSYAAAVTGRLSMDDCLPRGINARVDFSPLVASSAAAATPHQTPPATQAAPAMEGNR